MATVYKAYQPSMERYVALKVLPQIYAVDPDFTHRFAREARVIASLEHPNILPVYEYGASEGYTFLAMRLVETGTLTDLMLGKPLALSDVVRIIEQVASALDYAHSRGVVHRDVKPSNILVDAQGTCLLSDFGLAKVLLSVSMFTSSGTFLGTPKYASPEQCLGQVVDLRSDIYSLGVILYEMVTGRPPFDAETPMGIIVKHIHDPLPLPCAVNPSLPKSVEQVILKALAKNPDERFASAGELAEALKRAVAGTTPAAQPTALPGTTVHREVERKPGGFHWGWALAIVVFLGILGGFAWAGSQWLARMSSVLASLTPEALTHFPSPWATQSPAALPRPASATPAVELPSYQATAESALTEAAPFIEESPLWTFMPQTISADGEISLLREFKAPGISPTGLAWDGRNLWVKAEKMLIRIDAAGKSTNVYSLDPVLSPYGSSSSGMAWVQDSFWLIDYKEAHAVRVEGDRLVETQKPVVPDLGTEGISFAWDGKTLWAVNGYSLILFDASGAILKHYIYPHKLNGIAWDGRFLWVDGTSDKFDMKASGLYILDTLARTLAGFEVQTPPYEISEMAWDGGSLWVFGRTEWVGGQINLYQLDVTSAQLTAAEEARLLAETPVLFESLQCIPPGLDDTTDEKAPVKVMNRTEAPLTLTFETYNYSIQFAAGEIREITPLEVHFLAEVPGLPPIRGHYPFQDRLGCDLAWIFEITKPEAGAALARP